MIDLLGMDGGHMAEFNYGGWHYGTNWCDKAVTLKHAADTIREAYSKTQYHLWTRQSSAPDGIVADLTESDFTNLDLLPVFMLLMGFSMENILKGIIICGMWLDDPNSVNVPDYDKLRFPVKNSNQTMPIMKHDLKDLLAAKAICINFSYEEKDMMDKLGGAIIWAGRYTTSKKAMIEKSQLGLKFYGLQINSPFRCSILFTLKRWKNWLDYVGKRKNLSNY